MDAVWRSLHRHFIPSLKNAYRPQILERSWLLFFLALILVAEGFLVSSLSIHEPSDTFIAVASAVAVPTPQADSNSLLQSVQRQFVRFAGESNSSANLALAGIGTLLVLAVALAFFIHMEVQPTHMLIGGGLVAGFAFFLIFANSVVLSSGTRNSVASSVCAVDSSACPK